MPGNFFENFKYNKFKISLVDIFFYLYVYAVISLFCFVMLFIYTDIMKVILTDIEIAKWSILISVCLFIIFFVCLNIHVSRVFKADMSLSTYYTFKEFKDWYNLSPERIVFWDDSGKFYFIVEGKNRDMFNFVQEFYFKDETPWGDSCIMRPKTCFDSLRMKFFVNRLFSKVQKQVNKKLQLQEEKESNDIKLKVLNSLQDDIEDVLKDSQNKLNEEIEKLNNYRCSG